MKRRLMLLLTLAACAAQAAPPQSLGRLFLSPERRDALERQRQLNIEEVKTIEGSTLSLDGVVTRSSGRSTIWINGQAQHENARDTGVSIQPSGKSPGQAVILPADDAPESLRVGETINRGTREVTDPLGGGRITVTPKR